MDKYEFNIKVEQIKKMVARGDYETAMKISDTIDWRRVRNVNILTMVATIYEKNEEYQEAKDILLLAFERAPIGKRLVYKLAELAVKEGSVQEAEDYYREFCDLAPDDPRQYILRYLILGAKGAPVEQLIHTLEQYCNIELDEKWLYELAELYAEADMGELCIMACDKLMLMFGLGKYVDKAMELKQEFAPLTGYQRDLVENRDKYEARLKAVEEDFDRSSRRPVYDSGNRYEQAEPSPESYDVYQEAALSMEPEAEEYQEKSYQEEPYEEGSYQEEPYEGDPYEEESYQEKPLRRPVVIEPEMDMEQEEVFEKGSEEESEEPSEELSEEGSGQPAKEQPEVIHAEGTGEEKIVRMPEPAAAEYRKPEVVRRPADSPVTLMSDEAVRSRIHEARAQADLAREMSRISPEQHRPEQDLAQTRVLTDIKDLGRPFVSSEVHHFMIEAEYSTSGLDQAIQLLKKIHKETGAKNQAARISGEKLNARGVFAIADKLTGKDLIIEQAGAMDDKTLQELNQLMARDETGMNVILIDGAGNLARIHKIYPGLAKRFEYVGKSEKTEDSRPVRQVQPSSEPAAQPASSPAQSASELVRPSARPASRPAQPSSEPVRQETRPASRPAQVASEPAARPASRSAQPVSGPTRPSARPALAASEPVRQETRPEEEKETFVQAQERSQSENIYKMKQEAAFEPSASHKEDEVLEPQTAAGSVDYDDQEEMDMDEFAQYACKYASDIDCSISGKSMLALYERIEIMEEDGIPLTRTNAEDLIEEAADKAENPSFIKKITGIFSSKYDKNGLLILREEHFV